VTRLRGALLNSFAAVVATALLVPVSELLLRVALRAPTTYRALPPNLTATFEGLGIPGLQGPSVYKTNSMGVRAREWSSDRRSEYRVLCMGGSTTECLGTDQSRVWTFLLEQRLGTLGDGRRAWVGNIGRSGLTTAHHVLQARHLLDVYDPDCVVLLTGVNDLLGRLRQGDAYDPGLLERPEQRELAIRYSFAVSPGQFASKSPDDPWWRRTRLWQLLRSAKQRLLSLPDRIDLEGDYLLRWRAMRARGRRTSVLPPLEQALDAYGRNLREVVRLVRARNARVILMTHPVLWRAGLSEQEKGLLWMGGVGDFRRVPGSLYYEPEALAQGMASYNQRLLEVCRDTEAQCVDLTGVIPASTEYLFDDCHFTDRAQVAVAAALADAVLDRAPGR
jgi:lysophospholipase L1-like esterase